MRTALVLCGLVVLASCSEALAAEPDGSASETTGEEVPSFCGGPTRVECPAGYTCRLDPGCEGSDCLGRCRRIRGDRCSRAPRNYFGRDAETCATIRFFCAEGWVPFFDECGCGCELTSG